MADEEGGLEKKLEHVERIIDTMSHWQFMREAIAYFGPKRVTELAGWAVIWGLTRTENGPELRQKLREQGLSRSAIYRASMDFRKFGEELERKYGGAVDTTDVVRKFRGEGVPHAGQPVV